MTIHLNGFETGDLIIASVWHYSANKDNGSLVVAAGNYLNTSSAVGVVKDSAGWEQLIVFCTVPANHQDLGVYGWHNLGDPVWFDDMEVKRYKVHQ